MLPGRRRIPAFRQFPSFTVIAALLGRRRLLSLRVYVCCVPARPSPRSSRSSSRQPRSTASARRCTDRCCAGLPPTTWLAASPPNCSTASASARCTMPCRCATWPPGTGWLWPARHPSWPLCIRRAAASGRARTSSTSSCRPSPTTAASSSAACSAACRPTRSGGPSLWWRASRRSPLATASRRSGRSRSVLGRPAVAMATFHYDTGESSTGDPVQPGAIRAASGSAPGSSPALLADVTAVAAAACDISPDRRDHRGRPADDAVVPVARSGRALRAAARRRWRSAANDPVTVDSADAGEWLSEQLSAVACSVAATSGSPDRVATVVFHSIVWQYLPAATKDGDARRLAEAGDRATEDVRCAGCGWSRRPQITPRCG